MSALYLLRHGRAAGGFPDAERPLTLEGRAQAVSVGRWLAAWRTGGGPVRCSPALRCRETAEALGAGAVDVDQRLALDRPTRELLELARACAPRTVLVGHQPELLGLLAAWLPEGAVAGLALPPATLVGLRRSEGTARLTLYAEPLPSGRAS